MILPCEVAVKTILPAVKAIMARTIVEKHGYNEKKTADLLGLSQSAVSRYVGRERGNLLNIESTPEVLALIDQMVNHVIKAPDDKTEILKLFCQTCQTVRENGLMCPACQKDMPKAWAEKCLFCKE